MIKPKLSLLLISLILCAQIVFSQAEVSPTVEKGDAQEAKNEISPEIKKDAVDFLRNTAAEVNNMRTLENRISFSAEMAGLMWFSDETEARAMYQNVINNFRQLLAQYDSELGALEVTSEDINSRYSNTAKSKTTRKFLKAMGVRQQVATSLAEHDPQLAFEFFTETAQAVSNPAMRKQVEQNDPYFETRLLGQIAEKNVETALKYGRKSLEKGLNYETISLLKKIYEKDTDKGIAFGEDIVSKLKSDTSNSEGFYTTSALLSLGEETINNRKNKTAVSTKKSPIFSDQSMREIAEIMARDISKRGEGGDSEGYILQIEKYAPDRALQIRTKFGLKKKTAKADSVKTETTEIPQQPTPNSQTKDADIEKQLLENVGKLSKKELTAEEKQKIIEQSRATINSIDEPGRKLMALNSLTLQVAQLGDKKLALEIIDESRNLINYQPVNYLDYMGNWLLVSGYAQVDADKAFPILESTIYRLNDTIAAFVKVGEFIDVSGEMVEDGEIQLGSFGGGMTRDLMSGIGSADATVRSLAVADFNRTKDLTNKFERPEVRILSKMLVLRAVLGNEKAKTREELSSNF